MGSGERGVGLQSLPRPFSRPTTPHHTTNTTHPRRHPIHPPPPPPPPCQVVLLPSALFQLFFVMHVFSWNRIGGGGLDKKHTLSGYLASMLRELTAYLNACWVDCELGLLVVGLGVS